MLLSRLLHGYDNVHTVAQTHTCLLTQLPVSGVLLSRLKPSPLVLVPDPCSVCVCSDRWFVLVCRVCGVSRSWMISRWSESHFPSAGVSSCTRGWREEGEYGGGGSQRPHTDQCRCCSNMQSSAWAGKARPDTSSSRATLIIPVYVSLWGLRSCLCLLSLSLTQEVISFSFKLGLLK